MKKIIRWATLDPFIEYGEIYGRKVANTEFLAALLQADPFDEYHFFLSSTERVAQQKQYLQTTHPDLWERGAFHLFLHHQLHIEIAKIAYSCFHLSDCITHYAQLIRLRNLFSCVLFPVTGTTHSLCYERYMPVLLEHGWEGTSARDCVIATSASAKKVLEAAYAGLGKAYGIPQEQFPTVERIPLGVDKRCFTLEQDPQIVKKREVLTQAFELEGKTVLLCLGRITPYAKMDLLPLFDALERVQSMGGDPNEYTLIVAGGADEGVGLADALRGYARSLGIPFILLCNPDDLTCRALYSLAHIFISPSDNLQETFGLTLIEAAAAGLGIIASDFNGYKDTILHEETGLRVPTFSSETSMEVDCLAGLWLDNQYLLRLAQGTVVSVPHLAKALSELMLDSEKRHRLGVKAQERAFAIYRWEIIVERYIALWKSLMLEPITDDEDKALRAAVHPLAPSFARTFASYPTASLNAMLAEKLICCCTKKGHDVYAGKLAPVRYAGLETCLGSEGLRRLLFLSRKPLSVAKLISRLESPQKEEWAGERQKQINRERAEFFVLWALKHDYLELEAPELLIGKEWE